MSHEPPSAAFVLEEQEAGEVANILSRTQDATGPAYFLWEPPVDGDAGLRIVGERSVFVIGRPVLDDERVNAVRLAAADKEALRAELEQIDVSERTMFRDLVGFCQQVGANARMRRPMTAAACLRRANGAFVRGEYEDAVETYRRSLELRKASETYFLRGNAHAAHGNHGEAVKDYDRVLRAPDSRGRGSAVVHADALQLREHARRVRTKAVGTVREPASLPVWFDMRSETELLVL